MAPVIDQLHALDFTLHCSSSLHKIYPFPFQSTPHSYHLSLFDIINMLVILYSTVSFRAEQSKAIQPLNNNFSIRLSVLFLLSTLSGRLSTVGLLSRCFVKPSLFYASNTDTCLVKFYPL